MNLAELKAFAEGIGSASALHPQTKKLIDAVRKCEESMPPLGRQRSQDSAVWFADGIERISEGEAGCPGQK